MDIKRFFNRQDFPLNRLPPASFAYSNRLLVNNPSLAAYRARNFSTEVDIGFADNIIDATVLQSFVGSQNLLQHSEAFDNPVWDKAQGGAGSTPVVTSNAGIAPDGTLTADRIVFALNGGNTLSDFSQVRQDVSPNSPNTFSIWLKTVSGTANIQIRTNSVQPIVTVTTEWQRFSVYSNGSVDASTSFLLRGTFGTSNSATIEAWGAQLNTGNLQPYSPTSRRNRVFFSESIDNPLWRKLGTGAGLTPIVTPNAGIAPNGTLTADRVQFINNGSTSGDQSFIDQREASTITGQPFVYSFWGRTFDGSTRIIQLSANGASNANCTVTPEWQRFSLFYPSALDNIRSIVIRLRGTFGTSNSADLLIWGIQQEQSTILTPYQRIDGAWGATRDGNGFITTWYDQSGNTRTINQLTAENQPSITVNGFPNTFRGNRGLIFDSSDSLSGNGVSISYNGSVFSFSGATDIYPVFSGNTLLEVLGFDAPLSSQDKSYLLNNQQRYYNL